MTDRRAMLRDLEASIRSVVAVGQALERYSSFPPRSNRNRALLFQQDQAIYSGHALTELPAAVAVPRNAQHLSCARVALESETFAPAFQASGAGLVCWFHDFSSVTSSSVICVGAGTRSAPRISRRMRRAWRSAVAYDSIQNESPSTGLPNSSCRRALTR